MVRDLSDPFQKSFLRKGTTFRVRRVFAEIAKPLSMPHVPIDHQADENEGLILDQKIRSDLSAALVGRHDSCLEPWVYETKHVVLSGPRWYTMPNRHEFTIMTVRFLHEIAMNNRIRRGSVYGKESADSIMQTDVRPITWYQVSLMLQRIAQSSRKYEPHRSLSLQVSSLAEPGCLDYNRLYVVPEVVGLQRLDPKNSVKRMLDLMYGSYEVSVLSGEKLWKIRCRTQLGPQMENLFEIQRRGW